MNALKRMWLSPYTPYVLPFILFSIFLSLEGTSPRSVYVLYPIKTVTVGLIILLVWKRLPKITVKAPLSTILIGVVSFALWVGLDPYFVKHSPEQGGFNPNQFPPWDPIAKYSWLLIGFRIFGATIVVPIMEEIFWRGFLMRYLIAEDFEKVALGTYKHVSFWVTTAFFVSVHGVQWPLALIVGIIYGWWFLKTQSLGSVIVAHGVTNFLLGLYVLYTQNWYFW